MAKLAQSLGLNLTNALTGNPEILTDFFQRAGTTIIQSKPETKHLFFTRCKGFQYFFKLFFQLVYERF